MPGLHLWAAAIRQGHRPTLLHLETLTHPLRCPPSVVREVQQAEEMQNNDVLQYAEDVTLTSPTDGPTVTWLLHGGQQHGGAHPEYCEECGMATADYLRNKLNVGKSGRVRPVPLAHLSVTPVIFKCLIFDYFIVLYELYFNCVDTQVRTTTTTTTKTK